jgi:hypothetical protein
VPFVREVKKTRMRVKVTLFYSFAILTLYFYEKRLGQTVCMKFLMLTAFLHTVSRPDLPGIPIAAGADILH